MNYFYQAIKDRIVGKAPKGAKRSPKWREVRKIHLADNPACEVCGTMRMLEVHHIVPFHIAPDLELDPDNLITLCDGGGKYGLKSCHQLFGHRGRWKDINPNVVEDVKKNREMILGEG